MKILITNDDGIRAEGIYKLCKELEKDHELIIVAPDSQKSAQSQAITLFKPLVVREVELEGLKSKAYSVSGTPADCVRAAFDKIVDRDEIDLVVSGINLGLNAGMDILYSGTVSAAIEANIYEKPSMAISAEYKDGKCDFDRAAKYAREVVKKTKDHQRKTKLLLNVNVPYRENQGIKGIEVCKIGGPIYDYYFKDKDENGHTTLKVDGRKDTELEEGTDRYYLYNGYITITPLKYDLTNFKLLDRVREWIE